MAKLSSQSNRGVAIVFFLLVFGLTLAFTMMVMNTGTLVYQKIKLQSAVDLASYAGASVQASYLGNQSSGAGSIKYINRQILERHASLIQDLAQRQTYTAPWPQGFPDPGSCAAACQAANIATSAQVVSKYRRAVSDIAQYHSQVRRILQGLPQATQEVMEETIARNMPDLSLEQQNQGGLGAFTAQTTNQVDEVLSSTNQNIFQEKKNAVLSFMSDRGMYLANVVGNVPHDFPFFGPACFNLLPAQGNYWYCTVNGRGVGGGSGGFSQAAASYAAGLGGVGNIGTVLKISDPNSNSIQLHFVENPHRPKPFAIAAAEYYPPNGTFMNLENSFGAKGSLFPTQTRLVAVSGAEPFGGSLASYFEYPFGTRLQGLRRLLLDPRAAQVQEDYRGLYEYMEFLGPRDERGETFETAEEVIRRFLH